MSSIAEEFEEFEKMQNIKAKTHTTISTTINSREDHAADALSEFARFKLREQNAVYGLDTGEGKDQTAWTTVKITTPAFNDVSDNINKILEDNYIMDRLSKACIRDDQALYVRELLNRIGWCIRWLDESRSHGFNTDIPIAILKMDKETLEREYETICDLRSLDNYYVKDGEDVLAEILGVKDE